MPTSYVPAKPDVRDLVAEVMEAHHPLLTEAGVTVNALMAYSDGDHAVKHHGYPAYAVIKVNSTKDRVEGKADATLTIDAAIWRELGDPERRALVDHELLHLDPQIEGTVTVDEPAEDNPELFRKVERRVFKTDDAGRPKLKIRLHDWQFGGFALIAERHGEHAPEVIEARKLADRHGQLLFGFAEAEAEDLMDAVCDEIERDPDAFARQIGPDVKVEVRRSGARRSRARAAEPAGTRS